MIARVKAWLVPYEDRTARNLYLAAWVILVGTGYHLVRGEVDGLDLPLVIVAVFLVGAMIVERLAYVTRLLEASSRATVEIGRMTITTA